MLNDSQYDSIRTRDLHRSNDTRWNSVWDEIKVLYDLQGPFIEFMAQERARVKKTPKPRRGRIHIVEPNPEEAPRNAILTDALSDDDWEILKHYRDLLGPCHEATMMLQGRPGDGNSSSISDVLQAIEGIVEYLQGAYDKYKQAPADMLMGQWHFSAQIKLALDKAEQYYALLDNSAAYIAAVILHPEYNMNYLEGQWENKPVWITKAKKLVKSLWTKEYKKMPVSEAISPQKRPPVKELNYIQSYRAKGAAVAAARNKQHVIADEFDRYCAQDTVKTNRPIDWWRTVGSLEYPTLTQMALDILSIPAMSDEPERIFSRLGLMITPRRNRLDVDVVQASTCLNSWDRAAVIDLRTEATR